MTIWALADLHLAFGVPSKKMDIFGGAWKDYQEKIERNWLEVVRPEDLVLIPGDISWAMTPEEASVDFAWLEKLPGTKVMIRGNHDYWWSSPTKAKKIMPPSCHLIQNDVFNWQDVTIGGTRLWDTPEYQFNEYIVFQHQEKKSVVKKDEGEEAKIFERELLRLEMSLKALKSNARLRIAMTHYPPIGPDLAPSRASLLLEKYKVDICLFGHLHNVRDKSLSMGKKNGVNYLLTSCDYLGFRPIAVE